MDEEIFGRGSLCEQCTFLRGLFMPNSSRNSIHPFIKMEFQKDDLAHFRFFFVEENSCDYFTIFNLELFPPIPHPSTHIDIMTKCKMFLFMYEGKFLF
jgi:hypothetical protein